MVSQPADPHTTSEAGTSWASDNNRPVWRCLARQPLYQDRTFSSLPPHDTSHQIISSTVKTSPVTTTIRQELNPSLEHQPPVSPLLLSRQNECSPAAVTSPPGGPSQVSWELLPSLSVLSYRVSSEYYKSIRLELSITLFNMMVAGGNIKHSANNAKLYSRYQLTFHWDAY